MKTLRSFLILLVISIMLSSSFASASLIRRDDFRDRKSWWFWYSLCTDSPWIHNGVLHLYLGSASGYRECGSGIGAHGSQDNIFENYTAIMRVKALTPMRAGTRGWGFWDFQNPWPGDLSYSDFSWFMRQYDPFDSSQTWWLAIIRNEETNSYSYADLNSLVDESDWHIYKIESHPEFIAFYVDEVLVHYTDSVHTEDSQSLHIWIDNFVYSWDLSLPITNRAFNEPSALVVDFVEIYDGQLGSSQPPAGSLLLKEMPNETGSGETTFLWKEYAFESPGGKTLVLITARAEDYGDFSDDDDIRIVIDDIDLGWDTATSFNGNELSGENKSLVYMHYFEEGEHYLDIYGDITPILYDVTVIGAENGDVILNEELNEEAPGGNNYLWKDYPFNCANDEEVTVFVSASAHENTGDDDDIRLVLDGEDFGWDTDYSFSGDSLYGEARAIVIRRNLSNGSHTLRLYADETPILHNILIYGSEELSANNRPPLLDPIGNKTVNEGELLEFTITATDPDGDGLTYLASNLPSGASFDSVSQEFTWTPEYGQAGSYPNVLFTVTDNGYPPMSDSEEITITVGNVNRPPVLDPIGSKTVNEGELLEFNVTGSDPDNDTLTYSASNLSLGATFDPATQVFSWTPGYGQADNYNVLFSMTDDGDPPLSDSEEITITVGDVNRPPVLDPIGNKTVNEGVFLEFTVTASDSDGDNLTYSASNLPLGATFDLETQVFTWTPTYGQEGNYAVTFTVTDDGNPPSSDSEEITITVGDVNRPPVLDPIGNKTVNEGELLEFTVTANDPDGDNMTFSASNLPSGATFDPQTQVFNWAPGHGQAGTYTGVLFTVTDDGAPPVSDSEEITITVGDANRPPVLDPIGNKTVNEGELLEFTVTATDPDGDALTFSASNLPAGASFDALTQTFSWTPGYGDSGNYTALFNVTDNGNPPMSDSEEISIISSAPDTTPPYTTNHSPAPGESEVPANTLITLEIRDARVGVDESTITMTVNGSPVTHSISGTPSAYSITYDPPTDFGYEETVSVEVDAADLNGNTMTTDTYSFTTATAVIIVIDNMDTGFSTVGKWHLYEGSYHPYYGSSFVYNESGVGNDRAIFTLDIPIAGNYEVFAWLGSDPTGAPNCPFTINHADGSTTIRIDLTDSAINGLWVNLGIYRFTQGTSGTVVVFDDADGLYVVADAIRLEKR